MWLALSDGYFYKTKRHMALLGYCYIAPKNEIMWDEEASCGSHPSLRIQDCFTYDLQALKATFRSIGAR